MSSSNKTKPKATSGTASAIVNDDEDFNSFEGTRFYFYLDEQTDGISQAQAMKTILVNINIFRCGCLTRVTL
ncbi:hypothetical protein [Pseudomonas sp.]|uniref:hypothetical protein n=1 Tax=Pseudomonas sp. TaxID=306 RepID=UPI0025827621|nr:hypothetical protein [Pseudomonas sp.]